MVNIIGDYLDDVVKGVKVIWIKEEDLTITETVVEVTSVVEEITSIADRGKCIRQHVLNVRKNAKCRLSRLKAEMFSVEIVLIRDSKES